MKQHFRYYAWLALVALFPLTAAAVVIDDFEVGQINADGSLPPGVPGVVGITGSSNILSSQTGLPTDHVYSGNRYIGLDAAGAGVEARAYLDPDGPGGADDVLTFWQEENTRVDWYTLAYAFDPPVDLTAGWHDRLVITVAEGDKNGFQVVIRDEETHGGGGGTFLFTGPGTYEIPLFSQPGDMTRVEAIEIYMSNPLTTGDTEPTRYSFSDIRTAGPSGPAFITFEGYKTGEGTPAPGGVIGSQATGPTDPWFGSPAYVYMSGWNAPPRVPPSEYTGLWGTGGHAGKGADAGGFTSIDTDYPGNYVFDFYGYQFDHNEYITDSGDPRFGHEDRWYDGSEGQWAIYRASGDMLYPVAVGTLDDIHLDIDYGIVSGDSGVQGEAVLTLTNNGGDFYDEMMDRFGTDQLKLVFECDEPPVHAENPTSQPINQWAIYGGRITLTPLIVPEPAALVLLALGGIALWMIRRRR